LGREKKEKQQHPLKKVPLDSPSFRSYNAKDTVGSLCDAAGSFRKKKKIRGGRKRRFNIVRRSVEARIKKS